MRNENLAQIKEEMWVHLKFSYNNVIVLNNVKYISGNKKNLVNTSLLV